MTDNTYRVEPANEYEGDEGFLVIDNEGNDFALPDKEVADQVVADLESGSLTREQFLSAASFYAAVRELVDA